MSGNYSPTVLKGSNAHFARFGYSVVIGGDLDQNGFSDVVVGAPYEEAISSSIGAVYVYYVTNNGLSEDRKQVSSKRATKYIFCVVLHYL